MECFGWYSWLVKLQILWYRSNERPAGRCRNDVKSLSIFFLSDFTIRFLSKRRRFDFVWQLFQCLEKSGQWSLNHLELDQTQIHTFVLGNYNEIQMIESRNFFEPKYSARNRRAPKGPIPGKLRTDFQILRKKAG